MIELALYQPDIPQNVGAAIRLCACLGTPLNIIEPCGFPWDERKIRTSAMDYYDLLDIKRHSGWETFHQESTQRIVLLTTKTDQAYTDFTFQDGDILMLGRESAGVPIDIHQRLQHKVTIPMHGQARSINVINAGAIVLGEALRQNALKLEQ
ncbi:MAG: tRNA (cytidine(34)-2'-O)-methyltransferase [Pseudomonadota bacterium]